MKIMVRKYSSYSMQWALIPVILVAILFSCSHLFLPPYDPVLAEEILRVAKEVDGFYAELQDTPDSLRTFDKFSAKYRQMEVDMNSIILRNKIRPLNGESTEIAEITLSKLAKYKAAHKDKNRYKDALLAIHRKRFNTLFTSMFKAEKAKALDNSSDD